METLTDKFDLGSVGIVGGTGALGSGLAFRWARAGLSVSVGSRTSEKALEVASAIGERSGNPVSGASNVDVVDGADIVVLAVPFSQREALIEELGDLLDGKVLVDATVPLVPPNVGQVQLQQSGASVVGVQERLGPGVQVVSAFQNIGAGLLQLDQDKIECDVLVCANSEEARNKCILLCEAAGLRGIASGPLANAVAAEALTSVLISINRRYGVRHAGIQITGISSDD